MSDIEMSPASKTSDVHRLVMRIYCCGCKTDVDARLTNGKEVYPHRQDLYCLPFWKCDTCRNFVGCHHKMKERTRPLGCIPTLAVKDARKKIHAIIDPLWQSKIMARGKIYGELTKVLGREYHTAELRSVAECNLILEAAQKLGA